MVKLVINSKFGTHITEVNRSLYEAFNAGMIIKCQLFINQGADVNTIFEDGETLLMMAADRGDVKSVKFLLKHNAEVNLTSKDNQTALFKAVCHKNDKHNIFSSSTLEIVNLLIKHGADVNAVTNYRSCLFVAAFNGNLPMVETLLSSGANVNSVAPKCLPPILGAAVNYNPTIVRLLLNFKPDLSQMYSLSHSDAVNKPTASKYSIGTHLMFLHMQVQDIGMMEKIIDAGVDINSVYDNGFTRLSKSSEIGQVDMVKLLIDRGADINHKNKDGDTPLMIAINELKPDVCRILVENGADLNLTNKDDQTILEMVQTPVGLNHKGLLLLMADIKSTIENKLLMNSSLDNKEVATSEDQKKRIRL